MNESVGDYNQKSETEIVSVPNTEGNEEGGGKVRGKPIARKRRFPADTLEDTLRIASAIRDLKRWTALAAGGGSKGCTTEPKDQRLLCINR